MGSDVNKTAWEYLGVPRESSYFMLIVLGGNFIFISAVGSIDCIFYWRLEARWDREQTSYDWYRIM